MVAPALPPSLLVVDDDPGLLALIVGALQAEGWEVASASSGREALTWLRHHPTDLLLLDLKLQEMDGRDFLAALAKSGRPVPFVVITGHGDERVAVEMMKQGALDYLVKEVGLIEFVPAVVRRCLTLLERERRLAGAEKSSRESAERYRLLAEMAGSVVLLLGKDGTILEWSGAAERIFGYSAGEVLGRSYLQLFLNDAERSGVAKELQQIFAGVPTKGYENTVVTRSGATPTIIWNAALLRDGDGRAIGALSVGHDISQRKELERKLLHIVEREQRKFGQELHDGLGQRLTGLEMLSHGLAEDLKKHARALVGQAQRLNRELRDTVKEARLIAHNLAPVPLDGNGLMQGLTELAARTSRIDGVTCRFLCDPPVHLEDSITATHLYRIAQEAVNNALKHGRATRIRIGLVRQDGHIELSVENNGRAITPSARAKAGTGFNVMRYRAGMIGASLSIESGKRQGVRIACRLPRLP